MVILMNVLVTGSSRGIGSAIIKKFASNGWNVVINYNNSKSAAEKLESELEKYNIEVLRIKCDIKKEEEVKNMFLKIKEKFNSLDVIVNNAGISLDNELNKKDANEFMKVINTNLLGTYLVSKHGMNLLKKGSIINISSNNVFNGNIINSVDYDASKAGIISLTHDFAKYLAPDIRVNCICPGWINTDMNKNIYSEYKKEEENKILLKKFGEVEDIANVVYFLASNDAKYINDTTIRVDGGYGY